MASFRLPGLVFSHNGRATAEQDILFMDDEIDELVLPCWSPSFLNINQEEKFSSAFLGQWGIYAFPNSDTIIASDINNGLIVTRLSDAPCMGMKCSK